MRFRMGSRNAPVLPLPVWDWAMTSSPSSMWGMVWTWTGMSSVQFSRSDAARSTAAGRPWKTPCLRISVCDASTGRHQICGVSHTIPARLLRACDPDPEHHLDDGVATTCPRVSVEGDQDRGAPPAGAKPLDSRVAPRKLVSGRCHEFFQVKAVPLAQGQHDHLLPPRPGGQLHHLVPSHPAATAWAYCARPHGLVQRRPPRVDTAAGPSPR